MDETLVLCVVDLSGRPHLEYRPEEWPVAGEAGGVNHYHLREFLRGVVNHGRFTLHLRLLSGREAHHVLEASFKALARAPPGEPDQRGGASQHQGGSFRA